MKNITESVGRLSIKSKHRPLTPDPSASPGSSDYEDTSTWTAHHPASPYSPPSSPVTSSASSPIAGSPTPAPRKARRHRDTPGFDSASVKENTEARIQPKTNIDKLEARHYRASGLSLSEDELDEEKRARTIHSGPRDIKNPHVRVTKTPYPKSLGSREEDQKDLEEERDGLSSHCDYDSSRDDETSLGVESDLENPYKYDVEKLEELEIKKMLEDAGLRVYEWDEDVFTYIWNDKKVVKVNVTNVFRRKWKKFDKPVENRSYTLRSTKAVIKSFKSSEKCHHEDWEEPIWQELYFSSSKGIIHKMMRQDLYSKKKYPDEQITGNSITWLALNKHISTEYYPLNVYRDNIIEISQIRTGGYYKPDCIYGYHSRVFPALKRNKKFCPSRAKYDFALPFLICEIKKTHAADAELKVENQLKERMMHLCDIYHELEKDAGFPVRKDISSLPTLGFTSIGPNFTFWMMFRYKHVYSMRVTYDLRKAFSGSIFRDDDLKKLVDIMHNLRHHVYTDRLDFIRKCIRIGLTISMNLC